MRGAGPGLTLFGTLRKKAERETGESQGARFVPCDKARKRGTPARELGREFVDRADLGQAPPHGVTAESVKENAERSRGSAPTTRQASKGREQDRHLRR